MDQTNTTKNITALEKRVRGLPADPAKLIASFIINAHEENKRRIYGEALDYIYQSHGGFNRFLKPRIEARMNRTLTPEDFSRAIRDEQCPWNLDRWGVKETPEIELEELKRESCLNGVFIQSYCRRGVDVESIGQKLIVRIGLLWMSPRWCQTYARLRARRNRGLPNEHGEYTYTTLIY